MSAAVFEMQNFAIIDSSALIILKQWEMRADK